ncbi:hypothetical protein KI387_018899, partial [Taxus chinensis]
RWVPAIGEARGARATHDVAYYRRLLEGLSGVDIICRPYMGFLSYIQMATELAGLQIHLWIEGRRAGEHEWIPIER